MSELVQAAGPLAVTCHRAFDMTRDPAEALEALIRCRVGRVLTSGQRDTALEGAGTAGGSGTAGWRAYRHPRLRRDLLPRTSPTCEGKPGLGEMHFAALKDVPSAMRYRNPDVGMGGTYLDREYRTTVTDGALVAATIAAVRV